MSNQTLAGAARLDGRVAIVTGGTQGLGEGIASLFVERGTKGLVICGRDADKGRAVAKRLHGVRLRERGQDVVIGHTYSGIKRQVQRPDRIQSGDILFRR